MTVVSYPDPRHSSGWMTSPLLHASAAVGNLGLGTRLPCTHGQWAIGTCGDGKLNSRLEGQPRNGSLISFSRPVARLGEGGGGGGGGAKYGSVDSWVTRDL